jgi:hypothetical protein
MATEPLAEIQVDRNLRRLIWRKLIELSRAYETTRKTSERRRIAEIFDALLMMLSVAAVSGPLIITAIERGLR